MTAATMTAQPVIETDRFDLRPVRHSDAGLISHYGSDQRIAMMTTSIPHPLPPGATEAFLVRALSGDRTEDVWVLDGTRTGGPEVMGLMSLERLSDDQSEIGYWVAPAFWGKGVTRAGLDALLDTNPQGCKTVFGSVFQDNPVSAKVLTDCGFAYIGDAEVYCVARAANVPTWTYLRQM
ncbi:GNAT family N-acetyltransferase [Pseudaestuariivita atlantica]|uniref:Acetyltransferase n=1 Tax=Pseudaestuariivita atlantica TaxID=1317121 RepID=A0A0L1JU13_9RHOB|nr:GNAT family protein [Pseudaestuariivita atlantica]KNG95251.1 acetyltransferase [Pseudaestuariivita atlantica]